MAITDEKRKALKERMQHLGIQEEDLIEKFILGAGAGGQKINKTASCVYLKHKPTGIEIKCQQARSRELNRYRARQKLCEHYEAQILKQTTERQKQAEKIRRQKRRRSRKAQAKMLEEKRQRSEKKNLRRPPALPGDNN